MTEQLPGMGHNSKEPPPALLKQDLFRESAVRVNRFNDAGQAWKGIKELETDAQARDLADFIAGARKLRKHLDEERKDQKAIWDARSKAVQGKYLPFIQTVDKIVDLVKPLQTAWLEKKQAEAEAEAERSAAAAAAAAEAAAEKARLAEQRDNAAGMVEAEEEAKAAEQAAKAAAKPTRAHAQSATGQGRTMALRTTYYGEITNIRRAASAVMDHPAVIDAVQRAINEKIRQAKGEIEIPGVEVKIKRTAA